MPKHTVNVTAEDIREGGRVDAFCCPVALALRRAVPPHVERVGVTGAYAALWTPDCGHRTTDVLLPDAARAFIDRYDDGHDVEPFTFEIEIPDAK